MNTFEHIHGVVRNGESGFPGFHAVEARKPRLGPGEGEGSHVNKFEQVRTVADPVAGWGARNLNLYGHLWWPSFYDLYLQGQKGPGGAPSPPLDLLLHGHLEPPPPTPNPYVQIES